MTLHVSSFVVFSSQGNFTCCTCGWKYRMPDIQLSPLHETPTSAFLKAGFETGREFERHIKCDEPHIVIPVMDDDSS